jgi:hypothetical protein
MNMSIHKTVLNNLTLKIVAGIIAYGFWFILNQSRIIQIETQVPVCFYNASATETISAPETISVTLCGKSSDLRSIDLDNLACHIDSADLHSGDNPLTVTAHTLFLPESINLLHYYPSNGCIVVHRNNQQPDIPSHTHSKEQNIA